jgi:hypothetical protein
MQHRLSPNRSPAPRVPRVPARGPAFIPTTGGDRWWHYPRRRIMVYLAAAFVLWALLQCWLALLEWLPR